MLTNVDISSWKAGSDELQMRLAFNHNNEYDVLKFTFPWSDDETKDMTTWVCEDGYVIEEDTGKKP